MDVITVIQRWAGKTLRCFLAVVFALTAAQTVQAADCYWAGGTSSDWGTVANWTTGNKVPTNDGAYFRSDKFNNNFKSGNRAYLVTFNAAHTNNWRTFFCNCGTASAPIILRANNATSGLTSGDTTASERKNAEGIYIGTAYNGGDTGSKDGKASEGDAYVRFETGTFASGANYSYWFLGHGTYYGHMTVAGATINSPLEFYLNRGSLTVDSGTVNITKDVKMGTNGDATLTMNGGTMTVGPWTRFESSNFAKTINLNGGTLVTYRINKQGGSGSTVVNFNGGTLRIKTNYNSVIDSGITVNVKANGGTIDVNGTTTSVIPASFSEDSSSTGGGMKFCGGGTLTLSGSIGYTGGTTIEAGTTIKVERLVQKDALLGHLNTLKFIPSTTGTHTLITITGDGVFSNSDLLKVAVAPGAAGTAEFSISGDGRSLMANVTYAGGAINQSTPTLVFPGKTLADLATHTLRARFQGGHFNDTGVEVTFFNRTETETDGVLTKVQYQLQALDASYVKCVYVDFTADATGVYAKLADGNYGTYGGSLNTFGTEPLTSNASNSRQYYPYDFRLVEPVGNAINVNFTRSADLDTTSSVRYGGGDYAVPYSAWVNMPAANGGTMAVGGATVTITKTSGAFGCVDLNSAKDLRHGYLDDGGLTVVVDVADIPYEFYRIVTYHATDNADIKFGHVTINGIDYTGVTDGTVKGNASWGHTAARNKAKGLREGVNYLVSDIMAGSSVTITGHRDKSSGPTCRGCIAAIQIVEYVPTTYTATISNGGNKTFSVLNWDKPLPSVLTAGDQVVLNVNEDATLTFDSAIDVYAIKFNVAEGKTLTLAGNNILAQFITATGLGQTVVANASQLSGIVKGDGTLVYGAAPSGVTLTDSLWSGVLWLKNGTMNGLLAQNLASANSTLRMTGVTGYFNNGDSEMTCLGTLELVDNGATPAFTVSNGFSTNGKTVFAALKGNGTFKSDTTTSQRYVFKDVSEFTGTIYIPSGKNTRVILGNDTSLAPANGTITVISGATATVAADKTWTANGGMTVNGTLYLGADATAPAVVSGTGSVGVMSGTGTLNGYGADAALQLATAPGATLAIVNDGLTAMTVGSFNNMGTIDLTETALTEATLNLASGATVATPGTILYPATFEKFVVLPDDQSVRSLDGFTLLSLPEGAEYYVTLAETREEFGKGSMIVTDIAEGVNVRVVRPDGTSDEMTSVDGTVTLTEELQIAGAATAFDFTYTNTAEKAYCAPGLSIGWNCDPDANGSRQPTFNNLNADKTTGAYIRHHPWVTGAGSLIAQDNFTIVLVGTMSPSHNTEFFHMGTTTSGNVGILITTTDKDDEVLIAKNTANVVDAANGVRASVPNAATARHAYVINKKGTVFEVWVDGVKRGQFDAGEGFALSAGGMQIGSDHGGNIRNAGIYNAVQINDESETGYVNVLRMFDYVLSEAQVEKVFEEYPYVSQGGLYTRTVAADGTFSETDAWEKDGEVGTFAVPVGATVDEVYYNPSATLDVDAASEIEVNADVALDTFTVSGSAALTFKADGAHTVMVVGAAIINSPVTIEYGAVYLAGAPVQIGSSGAICFDCSTVDVSKVYEVTRFQLTGLIDQSDGKVTFVPPTDPDRSYAIAYNTTGSCYDLVVTPLHNYVFVDNKRTSTFTVDDDTIIVGAGGLDIETLVSPEDGRIVFDPVKTSLYVWGTGEGALTISNGTQFVLAPNYAGMALGRIVLLTYREGAALPENLDSLFDASSIASGATYAITSEDAPDPSGGRKQLVLTVGNYDQDAKEIRILPVGDSITQGVAANSGDGAEHYPQYRSTIAARLAANGYKPKLLGVWKRANYSASHVMIPEDWAWHSGISAERIITGGERGGVRDNMHVYLDIAGDVNAITFLIGTNDLGAGTPVADAYAAYTNLMFETAAQRPNAKIIGATILDRNGAESENHARVVEFNALLSADYEANRLPANFVMLDLYDAVSLAESGNFLADNLHLHWKGCIAAGEAFAGAIMSALPLTGEGAISGAPDPTVTDEVQTALGAEETIPADYHSGMTRVFTIDAAATNAFMSSPYTTVDDQSALSRPVSKAGYYMELVRKGTSRRRYVWVDFDATGKTLGDIDFPWEGENLDFVAEKLHVYSNDPYIHNVAANDYSVSGVVEGTWHNYTGTDNNDGVPADVVAGKYGWNDTMGSGNAGYGCFQVHRILSENEAEVLFAWNNWGGGRASYVDDIGIGSFAKSTTLGETFSMDYTFTAGTVDGAVDTLTANAYSVRRVEIWAVFDGAVRHGVWSGVGANSDFDDPANWEDGIVPSAGEDIDFSATPPSVTINMTGASAGKKFGTATMGLNAVTFAGEITFAAITDTSKIAVGENSTVTLDGDLMFSGSDTKYAVYTVGNGGRFIVTGRLGCVSGASGNLHAQESAGGGIVIAGGTVNNSSDYMQVCLNKASQKWAIGPGGMTGSQGCWCLSDAANSAYFYPLTNDFTVSVKTCIRASFGHYELNTTGFGDGLPHTITLDAGYSDSGKLFIAGTGKVVVNHEPISGTFGGYGAYSGAVTVQDTATLAINAGKKLTSGAITVNSGATLELAESGTNTVGNLTLANGAILGFNFTAMSVAPVLEVSGSVTKNGTIKVKAEGVHPAFGTDGKHTLTSGGKFAGATVAVAEGSPKWVKGVFVEDGEIVIEVSPAGMFFHLR